MPQPLPAELPKHFNPSANSASSAIRPTYSRILLLERAAHSNTNHEIREQKLVHARVLGYLILEGPSMQASEFVAREVNACQSEDQLDEMGGMYLHRYFRARELSFPVVVLLGPLQPLPVRCDFCPVLTDNVMLLDSQEV